MHSPQHRSAGHDILRKLHMYVGQFTIHTPKKSWKCCQWKILLLNKCYITFHVSIDLILYQFEDFSAYRMDFHCRVCNVEQKLWHSGLVSENVKSMALLYMSYVNVEITLQQNKSVRHGILLKLHMYAGQFTIYAPKRCWHVMRMTYSASKQMLYHIHSTFYHGA